LASDIVVWEATSVTRYYAAIIANDFLLCQCPRVSLDAVGPQCGWETGVAEYMEKGGVTEDAEEHRGGAETHCVRAALRATLRGAGGVAPAGKLRDGCQSTAAALLFSAFFTFICAHLRNLWTIHF
jgi:hypothetical protein